MRDRILGLYGVSDSGKTTFIQTMVNRVLPKYKMEKKRGITLKVGYGQYRNPEGQSRYFVDSPGHLCFSEEVFRNLPDVDLAIYLFSCEDLSDETRSKDVLEHYIRYTTVMKHYQVPFITVLNKAQRYDSEALRLMRDRVLINRPLRVLPCTSTSEALLSRYLKPALESCLKLGVPETPKTRPYYARVIKSFDVNKQGVPVRRLSGGVLGVLKERTLEPDTYYRYWDRQIRNWGKIYIKSVLDVNQRVCTAETESDPVLFRSDEFAGVLLYGQGDDGSEQGSTKPLSFRPLKVLSDLKKGEKGLLLISGSYYPVIVKSQRRSQVSLGFLEDLDPRLRVLSKSKVVIFKHLEGKTLQPCILGQTL